MSCFRYLLCVILLWSWGVAAPKEAISAVLAQDNLGEVGRLRSPALVKAYYKAQPEPAWLGQSLQADELIEIVNKAQEEGLEPSDYHAAVLLTFKSDHSVTPDNSDTAIALRDVLLTDAFLTYARDMGEGRPAIRKARKDWVLKGREINPVQRLQEALASKSVALNLQDLVPKYRAYSALKSSLHDYRQYAAQASWPPVPALVKGQKIDAGSQGAHIQALRDRLLMTGELAAEHATGEVYDAPLIAAVKTFQSNLGLDADGVVGSATIRELNITVQERLQQIIVNMERWRWMPEQLGKHYLVVDITGFEYFIVDDDIEVMRAKTVVGMAARPTPVFSADMASVVFAPYWNVPVSIAVKDKLPQLKQDPYRLSRSGIRVFDREGQEIDPGMVDWSEYGTKRFPYHLRQDPGAGNALGKVKFLFPNNHAIYMHDTPQKKLFDRAQRTYSSGCIRVQNPIELAQYLLNKQGWDDQKVKSAYAGSKERHVAVAKDMKIKVYILYMTAWVTADNQLQFRPDIYNQDAALRRALGTVTPLSEKTAL